MEVSVLVLELEVSVDALAGLPGLAPSRERRLQRGVDGWGV